MSGLLLRQEFACGIPHLLKGEFSQNVASGVDVMSARQPVGVCAGITPFNFPAMIPMWMFGMAISTGNACILKPSEKDPGVPMRLANQQLLGYTSFVRDVTKRMQREELITRQAYYDSVTDLPNRGGSVTTVAAGFAR